MTTQTAAGSTVAQLGDTTVATQTVAGSEPGGQSSTMLQLPLRELGLKYIPAIPVDVHGMADTVSRLALRVKQREQALQGLSKLFTIGGSTARAYNFLYGSGESRFCIGKPLEPQNTRTSSRRRETVNIEVYRLTACRIP
jgi:hypothetical protein